MIHPATTERSAHRGRWSTPAPRPSVRSGRGYLLLEVLVSGVVVASIVGFLLIAMQNQSKNSVQAGRDATAAMLMQQKIEQLNMMDFTYVNSLVGTTTEPITLSGNYTRTTVISPKGAAGCREFDNGSGVFIDCHNITVEVEYEIGSQVKLTQGTFRLYDPEPP